MRPNNTASGRIPHATLHPYTLLQRPNDPERNELRGTLRLGETVVIETVGGHDQDLKIKGELKPGAVMEVRHAALLTAGRAVLHRGHRTR